MGALPLRLPRVAVTPGLLQGSSGARSQPGAPTCLPPPSTS